MAQDEEMKRLLLKGKIVGFEWHQIGDGEKHVELWYRRENNLSWLRIDDYAALDDMDYDSFELGIKQDNGEWFFEGDILTDTIFGYEVFVLHYHNGAFCYNRPIDRDFAHSIKTLDDVFEWKCLGNIHENPELINQ